MDNQTRRRFSIFGLACALFGWALAAVAQWMRLGLGWVLLMLVGMLLGVAWVSDLLTAAHPPPTSGRRANDPGD